MGFDESAIQRTVEIELEPVEYAPPDLNAPFQNQVKVEQI